MQNSLREEANNLISKIVELRLSITHPNNEGKVFILLEGKTDIRLFRKLFSSQRTDSTALDGKDKVVTALNTLLQEGFSNIIGIKDADFEHVEPIEPSQNLFLTDFHDIEIQMIESNAFNSLICEYFSSQCQDKVEDIKRTLYEIALIIGYTRWFNEKEKVINEEHIFLFEGLSFQNFITVNSNCTMILDQNEYFSLLIDHSKSKNPYLSLTVQDLKDKVDELKGSSQNEKQICCGHDMTKLLERLLSNGSNCDQSNINQDKIESGLRLGYDVEAFKQTTLYNALLFWEESHNYRLFI